jgi:hypothetical protein
VRVRVLCLAVLLVTGACATTAPPRDDEPRRERPMPVTLGAIVGAIDPCALLGNGEAQARPEGEWGCTLGEFRATITDFAHVQRFRAAPIDVAGVLAYQLEYHLGVAVEFDYSPVVGDEVVDNHCAVLRGRVSTGIRVLADDPDIADLLYLPGENDSAVPGACAHLMLNSECRPCSPTSVPAGADAIVAAVAVDPQVQCVVFAEAVARLYGESFTPISQGLRCLFVHPDHQLEIGVQVGVVREPSATCANRGGRNVERSQRPLAGRTADTYVGHRTFGVCVSPRAPVLLAISLTASTPRGVSTLGTAAVPLKDRERALAVVDQVLARHFG